jgi:hypothetical protein
MSAITRGDSGELSLRYSLALQALARTSLRQDIVFFLGAGASLSTSPRSLPSGRQLSEELARECKLDWHESIPLSTAAFYYEFFQSRDLLNEFIRRKIEESDDDVPETLLNLAHIIRHLEEHGKQVLVITTNYDRKFEQAYEQVLGRKPGVIVYNGGTDANSAAANLHPSIRNPRTWQPREKRTYLYKMHGCISDPEDHNLVITEEDYINFLSNALSHNEYKSLLNYVMGCLEGSTVLFIGYGLADWNFRVLFKATAERDSSVKSYAVQRSIQGSPSEADRARWEAAERFWSRKNVEIIDVDGQHFTRDLLEVLAIEANKEQTRKTGT